jgi:hypothetical protein
MYLSPPIEIEPCDTYNETLSLFGGLPRRVRLSAVCAEGIGGTCRFVISTVYWHYDHDGLPWGEEVPLAHRTSDTFEILTPKVEIGSPTPIRDGN